MFFCIDFWSFSQIRERILIETMSNEFGVAQPVQGGNLFIKFGISSLKEKDSARKLDVRGFRIGSRRISSESRDFFQVVSKKSEENPPDTKHFNTRSAEISNMIQTIDTWIRSSEIRRRWKSLQSNATFSMDACETKVLIAMMIISSIVTESRHPFLYRFLVEFGIFQNTNFEYWRCTQQKLRYLHFSSPSWVR